jgi:hypothetical protein
MKRKVIISLIAILILMLSQYKLLLTGYARFFTIDNPVYGFDAPIVVLSGGLVTRIPKALELYEKGAEKISQALNIQVEFEVVPSLKGGATSTFFPKS